ncbi:MAG: hypothetical protein MZU97_08950 [Bacillus subtilis]|nr:hypothetical protein [Bacillus subtilis]
MHDPLRRRSPRADGCGHEHLLCRGRFDQRLDEADGWQAGGANLAWVVDAIVSGNAGGGSRRPGHRGRAGPSAFRAWRYEVVKGVGRLLHTGLLPRCRHARQCPGRQVADAVLYGGDQHCRLCPGGRSRHRRRRGCLVPRT